MGETFPSHSPFSFSSCDNFVIVGFVYNYLTRERLGCVNIPVSIRWHVSSDSLYMKLHIYQAEYFVYLPVCCMDCLGLRVEGIFHPRGFNLYKCGWPSRLKNINRQQMQLSRVRVFVVVCSVCCVLYGLREQNVAQQVRICYTTARS